MHTEPIVSSLAIIGLMLAAHAPHPVQDPPQPLKSGVELVLVDAQVVDRKGEHITGLKPEQFRVSIDGRSRTVVSAELIDANTGLPRGGPASSPARAAMPNIYVLAVDQGSFRPVNAPSVIYAARELLKRAKPNDYVGMMSFPAPGVVIHPTRERAQLEAAIPRLVGFSALKQMRQYQYSLSDAIDVAARDRDALQRVVQRNCQAGDMLCPTTVEQEMNETISILELQAARSLAGLRDVVAGVKGITGRKTVVVLSAGIPTGDRSGARMYMRSDATQAGKEAAAAGILLYTLHLNSAFLDQFSPDAPSVAQTAMREASVYARALDVFNGTAGGTFMEVNTSADSAIDRMMRETSAYYLLGVEVQEADRDGQSHRIQVKVDARGANVRSRASFVIPKRSAER
ncbi:MAG TPA: VWA domain-containing protein [Vicinamibacterales bacterium]|nr:VWA domain-containing protein [Vicinamibacterales bacterium]